MQKSHTKFYILLSVFNLNSLSGFILIPEDILGHIQQLENQGLVITIDLATQVHKRIQKCYANFVEITCINCDASSLFYLMSMHDIEPNSFVARRYVKNFTVSRYYMLLQH